MSGKYTSYGRARKRVKVMHRMTPYDYAVRSIIFSTKSACSGECQNILEGEALMENIQNRSQYLATFGHVHSDQRALLEQEEDDESRLTTALESLRFAGFAVTGFDQKHGVYEQGFMATIGGVNTVMNTGDGALRAGDSLYVIPTKKHENKYIKGVHRDKHQFALVNNESKLFKDAADAVVGGESYLQKFAVGTCIRGGRVGQPVDVVLHANANCIKVGSNVEEG